MKESYMLPEPVVKSKRGRKKKATVEPVSELVMDSDIVDPLMVFDDAIPEEVNEEFESMLKIQNDLLDKELEV